MTVAEMLGRISSRELSEWMAYYEMQTPERRKIHSSKIGAYRGDAESAEFNINQREKSPQEIYQMFKTWAVLHGG